MLSPQPEWFDPGTESMARMLWQEQIQTNADRPDDYDEQVTKQRNMYKINKIIEDCRCVYCDRVAWRTHTWAFDDHMGQRDLEHRTIRFTFNFGGLGLFLGGA